MVGCFGQAAEDVVLEEAQVDLAPQLAAEDIGQSSADGVECPPCLHFVGAEPYSLIRPACFFWWHRYNIRRERFLNFHLNSHTTRVTVPSMKFQVTHTTPLSCSTRSKPNRSASRRSRDRGR